MSTYASDDDGDVPVFSAAGLPDGLSIDVVLIDAAAGGATVQAQGTITVTNVDTKRHLAR